MTSAPALIRFSGPIARRLLRAGLPMGPNLLLTVRGRASGRPRTVPVAVVKTGGRRFVVGTFGDVHWTRNLRAAGEAELNDDGRWEPVEAVELTREEATAFFRDTIPAYLRSMPLAWRALTRVLVRIAAPEIVGDPQQAARRRPVFELRRRAAATVA